MNHHFTTIKELPDSEKPYEKFLVSGVESLSDAELIAVIIRSGTHGTRSVEVAQELLRQDGHDLLNLYTLSVQDMQKIPGIGQVKAIQLKCIAELSKRMAKTRYKERICLSDPGSIASYYMEDMRHESRERTMVLLFDAKCRLLEKVMMSVGSATAAFVSPREIFLAALDKGAIQIVLMHNHPSGDPTPSREDFELTQQIARGAQLLGITLADHIVIGDQKYCSFREEGLWDTFTG